MATTPTLVPAADRAPSLASRVVTIHATDVTEGAPAPDSVTFSLPDTLRVPADDVILRPGGVMVRLVDGRARVRLPVYTGGAVRVDGSSDWVIKVSPSWGEPYAIRVPAGTSEVSLADIPSVRALTRREQMYAITGVGVTVTEGAQAGGTASYENGQLDFKIQVPSFRPDTVYPYIDQQVNALTDEREQEIRDDLDNRLREVTSAFELAVSDGYEGTLTEWLDSLVGPKGEDSTVPGPPNVLSVGEVVTGEPDGGAAAEITGTAPEQVLDLTIPQGVRGKVGPRGPAGNVEVERPAPGVWQFLPEELVVQISDVDGLAARLAAVEYDTGWRDMSDEVHGYVSGALWVRRTGNTVWIRLYDLVVEDPPNTWVTLTSFLPAGLRTSSTGYVYFAMAAQSTLYTEGPLRIDRYGNMTVYGVLGGKRMSALVSFPTDEARPLTPPGSNI